MTGRSTFFVSLNLSLNQKMSQRVCMKAVEATDSKQLSCLLLAALIGDCSKWTLVRSSLSVHSPDLEAEKLSTQVNDGLQSQLVDKVLEGCPRLDSETDKLTPMMAQFIAKYEANERLNPSDETHPVPCLRAKIGCQTLPEKPCEYWTRLVGEMADEIRPPMESFAKPLITTRLMADLIKTDWFRTKLGKSLALRILDSLRRGTWAAPVRRRMRKFFLYKFPCSLPESSLRGPKTCTWSIPQAMEAAGISLCTMHCSLTCRPRRSRFWRMPSPKTKKCGRSSMNITIWNGTYGTHVVIVIPGKAGCLGRI